LGLNQVTYVSAVTDIDPAAGTISLQRRAEGGIQEITTRLPALITMLEASNDVRRGSLPDALRAARAEVVIWNAAGAGITEMTKCGLRGSPTVVKRVFAPPARAVSAEKVETANAHAEDIAEALIAGIYARQPALEGELLRMAAGY
jgi:electron transfer flavoprotein beta subunit